MQIEIGSPEGANFREKPQSTSNVPPEEEGAAAANQQYRQPANKVHQKQQSDLINEKYYEQKKDQEIIDISNSLNINNNSINMRNSDIYQNANIKQGSNNLTAEIQQYHKSGISKNVSYSQVEGQPNNILDIANVFLNSPLMQHLSSQDNDISENNSQMYPNDLKKINQKDANTSYKIQNNVTAFDADSPSHSQLKTSQFNNRSDKKVNQSQHLASNPITTQNQTQQQQPQAYPNPNINLPREPENNQQDAKSSLTSSPYSMFNPNEEMKGFF